MEHIYGFLEQNLDRILTFALVLAGGALLLRGLLALFGRAIRRSRLRGAAGDFLCDLIKTLLWAVYLIVLLAVLGVPVGSIIALFSAFALAVSLALQNTFSNVAAGILTVSTKPFEEGDFVDIDGKTGTVTSLSIFHTKLTTPDNKVITLPNNTVAAATVTNYSANPTRRLELSFPMAYDTDLAAVKGLVAATVARHGAVLSSPEPQICLSPPADPAAAVPVLLLRVWVRQQDYWQLYFELNEALIAAFGEKGIRIAPRRLDVQLRGEEGATSFDKKVP